MNPNGAVRGDEMALPGTYMSGSKQVDIGQGSDDEYRATSHVRGLASRNNSWPACSIVA